MERATPKKRVNRIALARFEQWALPRMARRMPAWVTPDGLTLIGMGGALLSAVAYVLTAHSLAWLWVASLGFVIHWWGDSLDGTLARVRDIRRERYGFYVDHQCDAVSALLFFGGMGLSPLMPLTVALVLLVGVYLMMIMVHLVTISRDVFKISFGGVGPTEGRLLMVLANTAVFFLGNPTLALAGYETTLFGAMGIVGAAGLLGYYVVFSLLERNALARLDPPPPAGGPVAAPPHPSGGPVRQSVGSR